MVSAATLIGFPATAYAGGPPNPAPSPSPTPAQFLQFQNSSQNISCNLGSGGAVCEIGNRAYTISTPLPPCAQHSAWGDRFSLNQSGTVQTSETAAMRCTDSSTGHFFYMSPGSYQIG